MGRRLGIQCLDDVAKIRGIIGRAENQRAGRVAVTHVREREVVTLDLETLPQRVRQEPNRSRRAPRNEISNGAGRPGDLTRLNKGYKSSIEILKTLRDPRTLRSKRRTPYEGVPTYSD